MVKLVLALVVLVNGLYAVRFAVDFKRHSKEAWKEPGNNIFLAIWGAVVFFFSSLGISDFALSTVVYRALKLLPDRKLPGTLNTQCVIPVAVQALAFISVIAVDPLTLILCIVAQVIGAYVGPRIVVKLPVRAIRICIGIGLLLAAFFIVAGRLSWIPSGGTATSLRGVKLLIAMVALFFYGMLNNMGIGSYPPTMATVYALGMNPAVAFPIMMGACTFSVPVGSMEFIHFGEYGRKITFFSSIFGVLGVLVAVFFVKGLNLALLQWLVAIVVLYAGITLLIPELKRKDQEKE